MLKINVAFQYLTHLMDMDMTLMATKQHPPLGMGRSIKVLYILTHAVVVAVVECGRLY